MDRVERKDSLPSKVDNKVGVGMNVKIQVRLQNELHIDGHMLIIGI